MSELSDMRVSPAWKSPKSKYLPTIEESAASPALKNALAKIAAYAVDNGITMAETIDYLKLEMVKAGSSICSYGEKKRVAAMLGVSRNTISRIRAGGGRAAW